MPSRGSILQRVAATIVLDVFKPNVCVVTVRSPHHQTLLFKTDGERPPLVARMEAFHQRATDALEALLPAAVVRAARCAAAGAKRATTHGAFEPFIITCILMVALTTVLSLDEITLTSSAAAFVDDATSGVTTVVFILEVG